MDIFTIKFEKERMLSIIDKYIEKEYLRSEVYKICENLSINDHKNLKLIVKELHNVFDDGKLELHEIPQLIYVFHQNLMEVYNNFTLEQLENVIKCLIYYLIHEKIIKINVDEIESMFKVMEFSLKLLCQIPIIFKSCNNCSIN